MDNCQMPPEAEGQPVNHPLHLLIELLLSGHLSPWNSVDPKALLAHKETLEIQRFSSIPTLITNLSK